MKYQCRQLFMTEIIYITPLLHDENLDETFRLDQIEFYCQL